MLQIIAVVLIILWLLGFITAYTMGGFIHILLVIAIVLILVRIIKGKPLQQYWNAFTVKLNLPGGKNVEKNLVYCTSIIVKCPNP